MDPKVFYGSRKTKVKLNDGNGAQYIENDVIVEPLPGNISDESSSDEDQGVEWPLGHANA